MAHKAIGISLGTSNSAVALMQEGKPMIISNTESLRKIPSMVAVNQLNEILVGQLAKRQVMTNPKFTVFGVKRLIGRKYDSSVVQNAIKKLPYLIKRADNGDVRIDLRGKLKSPAEISSIFLASMKKNAELYLGEAVTDAVITVPAYFDQSQRQATKDAGKIAGLNVVRTINEPTAASLAYGLDKSIQSKLAVVHLGGGTFDVSILEIGAGMFEVQATSADTYLGGDDFDQRLVDYLIDEFEKQHGIDLSKDRMALQRLKEGAEKAKIDLTTIKETVVNLPFITADASGPKHLKIGISESKLVSLTADLLDKFEGLCLTALRDTGLTPSDIDEVILAGGMTRMWAVQKRVKKVFGKNPLKSVKPDEVAAIGAAIQAGGLAGDVIEIDKSASHREIPNAQPDIQRKIPEDMEKADKIFISYRREDSADITGRIYDRLVQHFNRGVIFKDVDSIPLGLDFRKYIDEEVSKCKILLVVVGKDWLSIQDAKSDRRIDNPEDFVRIEIESGLKRNIPVIPLLVGDAKMPSESSLPESLQDFAFRNAIPIRRDPDFHNDVNRLIKGMEELLKT